MRLCDNDIGSITGPGLQAERKGVPIIGQFYGESSQSAKFLASFTVPQVVLTVVPR